MPYRLFFGNCSYHLSNKTKNTMIINGNKNINQNIKNIDVSLWLLCTIITLIFLIIIGGITRLTESGLSITEWQPISGIFFPFSEVSWQKEFDKYKQIPEFF